MKTSFLIFMFTAGITARAFASAGYARDGWIMCLAIAGILLLVVVVISGIDFLRKNGRMIFQQVKKGIKDFFRSIKEKHLLIRLKNHIRTSSPV